MKKMLTIAATACLVFSACGGDDDGGSPEDRIVDALTELVEAEGGSVDGSCIRANMVGLSDDDLEEIASSLEDQRDPEGLSAEAEQAGEDVFNCISIGG